MEVECEVCFRTFGDKLRPRVLPCAHSFCEFCINDNIKNNRKTCPVCREPFESDIAKDLPANYALEKLMQKIKSCKDLSVEGDIRNFKELKNSITEEANELIKKSEMRIDGLKLINDRISDKIKIKNDIVNHLWEEIDALNKIKSRTEQAISLVGIFKKINIRKEMVKDILIETEELDDMKSRVEEAETLSIEKVNDLKESQIQLNTCSTKGEMTEACQDILSQIHELKTHILYIEAKYDLESEFGDEWLALYPTLFIKAVKEKKEKKVWAVAEIDQALYGAPLFIMDDEVHMEAMMKMNPPSYYTVNISAFRLLSLLPEKNPKVYMSLSLNGEYLGTVYITICPSIENGYGKHFLALFTGSLGPSYRGIYFQLNCGGRLSVFYYMKADGTKGFQPLVPDYKFGSEPYSKEKGSVFRCGQGGFTIFHKYETGTYNTKYGTVTSGMEIIENVIDNDTWGDVKLFDVGVIFG